MYKRILVGVDGSKISTKALETAARLAAQDKADLFVFHAVRHHYHSPFLQILPGTPYPSNFGYNISAMYTYNMRSNYGYEMSDEMIQEQFITDGKNILEDATQKIASMGLKFAGDVDFHLEMYQPPTEYARFFAEDNNIDLIVVGCKGHHSRARRALMGTVATKLLNDSPCQVLVVG